jgi:long-chain acyl-CoA synthetase
MPLRGGHHFDVVPVDSVARGTTLALVDALRDRNGTGGVRAIRQLASSDHHPLTLGRALDLTTIARRRQYARSDDLFERWVLVHLDSVLAERAAEHDPWLPAARRVLRTLRDVLSGFDPDVHLPRGIRDRVGDALSRRVQKASKALGTAARTLGRIEEMLRAYQPFVWDDDFVFRTDATRAATAMLDPEERALFGFDVDTLDWRHYWLEVQIPGLDRWSLPLLRGEQPPEDPPFALEPPLCAVGTSDFEHTPAPMFGAFEETAAPLGEDTE